MKNPTITLCLLFLISANIFSQKIDSLKADFSLVTDKKIKRLFKTYNDLHEKKINVFKIQLFHHENRNYTWKMKNKYQELYPDINTDFFYESPYFKVTSEYFTTRILAEQKMDSIKKYFPDCFIIKSTVPLENF